MKNLILITGYTLKDQIRQKSFVVLLAMSIVFLFLMRGCYGGNFTVNGKMADSLDLFWRVSIIGFHVISVFMFFMASLLAMRVFTRDRENGGLVMVMSRPVSRWQYAGGRLAGIWIYASAFLFTLHFTVNLIVWSKTGAVMEGYLIASLSVTLNLMFVILCTALLSLFLPDVLSAVITLIIVTVGFVSDGGHRLMNSDFIKSNITSEFASNPEFWRVLYPKVFMVQSWAGTMMSKAELVEMGPVHPAVNLSIYILLLGILLNAAFKKKEI